MPVLDLFQEFLTYKLPIMILFCLNALRNTSNSAFYILVELMSFMAEKGNHGDKQKPMSNVNAMVDSEKFMYRPKGSQKVY